jgi:hypothetical protein
MAGIVPGFHYKTAYCLQGRPVSYAGRMTQFIAGCWRFRLLHLGVAVCLSLISFGCKSTPKTPSNRLASVVIKERTPNEIEAATRTVFERHDYEMSPRREGGAMVFEKKGSTMNGLVYGDWYSGGVWERVKIYHVQMEPGSTLLDCDAYMVQEHDDPFFQSERKTYNTRRHVYQKLLEEVVQELDRK